MGPDIRALKPLGSDVGGFLCISRCNGPRTPLGKRTQAEIETLTLKGGSKAQADGAYTPRSKSRSALCHKIITPCHGGGRRVRVSLVSFPTASPAAGPPHSNILGFSRPFPSRFIRDGLSTHTAPADPPLLLSDRQHARRISSGGRRVRAGPPWPYS